MDAVATTTGEDRAPDRRARPSMLDELPGRQRLTGAQAAHRSLWVRRFRIILPVMALALIAVLMLSSRPDVGDDAFLEDFANLEARPEELKMANPRFAGVDDKGFPYEVEADTALQAPGRQDVVELINPRAVTQGADSDTQVSANAGVFQTDAKVLDLKDEVTLNHKLRGETYVFKTPAATVSIDEETVHSTAGIEGDSESGSIKADRMQAYNNEGRIVFEGNVSMRLYPRKVGLAPKEEKEEEEGQVDP